MKHWSLTILFIAILCGGYAHAQKERKPARYTKTQEVKFDGQDVDGHARSPDGAYVNPKKGIKFLPLYKVDKRFEKSIKESVEFVR